MKKILSMFLMISVAFINMMPVSAASYKLNIEKEAADIKYLENQQGYISKKIVASDLENGEVTVELTVANSKTSSEENSDIPEIMIVVDNSVSMAFLMPNGEPRKTAIMKATKNLVSSIYATNSSAKVGLVRFAGKAGSGNYNCEVDYNLESYCGSGQSTFYYGGNASSYLMQKLTADKNTMITAINNLENLNTPWVYGTESGTDIAAGIKTAYNAFSGNSNNKTIIVITDGLPTHYLGSYDGDDEFVNTNSYIKTIAKDTNLITVLTGVTEQDTGEGTAEDVIATFGTEESPAADKYYNISDATLNKTITEDILSDVKGYIQSDIKNVTIKDYFPSDIKDNFEFSYVKKPTVGTLSSEIASDNTITYTTSELKGNESVVISYKLKLKDLNNSTLLDKVISTNEKVVLTYVDGSNKDHEVTLTSSPSVKLVKIEEPKNDVEETVDNPPTGLYISMAALGLIGLGIVGISILKNKNYFNKI